MCAKSPPRTPFKVRSPEALQSLEIWLGTLDDSTRKRGRAYYKNGHVSRVWSEDDDWIAADVQGQELYDVSITLTGDGWHSDCTCPMEIDCKHVVAASLAWIARGGADFEAESERDAVMTEPFGRDFIRPHTAPITTFPASASAKKNKLSFRDQWTPVLAEKLGRSLTAEEGTSLGHLSALFTEFKQSHNQLYARSLRHYGFPETVPPDASNWEPLFRDWWTYDSAPADPWALWQYLAYSLEQRGRSIPEVFRPLTDTAAVHATLDDILARQQLDEWSRALSSTIGPAFLTDAPLFAPGSCLRARLDVEGQLFVELRSAPDKPWKPPTQKWANALAQASAAQFELLPPAEAALALALTLVHRHGYFAGTLSQPLPPQTVASVLASRATHPAILLPDRKSVA